MPGEFDIIIVGAGLVGTSFALALAPKGFKIAIIEKHLPEVKTTPTTHFRPISLAYSSVEILKMLGLWEKLGLVSAPINEVHISEQGILGGLHFLARELQVSALGYVVPFAELHNALYQRAAQMTNIEIIPINNINHIHAENNLATVTVNTAKGDFALNCALLVASDGAHSTVRDLMDIPTDEKLGNEVSFTATLTLAQPHQAVAFERFSKEGTLAILPLPEKNQVGMVWTMPTDKCIEVKNWDDKQFIDLIHTTFRGRLGSVQSIKKGVWFPLETIIARKQFTANVVLLGNAAHTIYPFAAQGFNLGLRDAAALAEIIVEAQEKFLPLGDNQVLQKYVAWRQADQNNIRRLTGGIARLVEIDLPLARHVRGLGMLLTDLASPLKKRIAKQTLGLAGKLPKLARGIPL